MCFCFSETSEIFVRASCALLGQGFGEQLGGAVNECGQGEKQHGSAFNCAEMYI